MTAHDLVNLVFYFFSAVTVVSAVMVITAKNPVASVLFLVLTFFTSAELFVLIEAEFLAMILVMVYMGAVAILFLFVVMMIDIDFATLRQGFNKHLPLGLVVAFIIAVEMGVIVMGHHSGILPAAAANADPNTLALGKQLYTTYLFPFEVISLILLVALIGAVALTHRVKEGVKRQNVAEQIARRREDAVELKKVNVGEGA